MSPFGPAHGRLLPAAPVDLQLLRTFVAVADAGSVNLAAGELHLSQASVSRQVQRLERSIGAELFARREGRSLELTAAGRAVLDPAVRMLEEVERQWRDMLGIAREPATRLVVGFGPAIALLPEGASAIQGFRAAHPQLDLQLVEQPNRVSAVRDVLGGTVDFALTLLGEEDADEELASAPIADMRLKAFLPQGHPLADAGPLTLADLANEPFGFVEGSDAQDAFLGLAWQGGAVPHVAHRCTQTTTLVALLLSGEAVTVAFVGEGPPPGPLSEQLHAVPLAVEQPPLTLSVCWRAARPPEASATQLAAGVRGAVRRHGGGGGRPARRRGAPIQT